MNLDKELQRLYDEVDYYPCRDDDISDFILSVHEMRSNPKKKKPITRQTPCNMKTRNMLAARPNIERWE